MIIKKRSGTFDVYNCELSYAELMALREAGQQAGDPIADECSKAIDWYFAHEVAPPGVDEHPSKAAKDDPEIDALLPDDAKPEVIPPGGGGEGPAASDEGATALGEFPADPGEGDDEEVEVDEVDALLPEA